MPGNHCRAHGRCGEVCEEAAANWGEVMRGDLTACRGKGQISRNRRGKCQGLNGVLGMEGRWMTSGVCQDWGRKARLGFVDVEVLGGGCGQLVAGLEPKAGRSWAGTFNPHVVLWMEAAGVEGRERRVGVKLRECAGLCGE